ncbi:DUF11 domain-containing protein, partial [Seonamhaeicola algicola]|uniref:DUF11 domain-containing protein n=1 Tax=Seonamhaeicola algicola TaxID=1719036 RepID=UPI00164B3612
MWSQSGPGGEWQAQAGSVYVRLVSIDNITQIQTETMGCAGAYSDTSVDNNPSLRLTANVNASGVIDGNLQFAFFDGPLSTTLVPVNTPIIHVDRVGGSLGSPGNTLSNSGLFTLTNGTWSELSQNGVHLESTASTFYRTTGTLLTEPPSTECGVSTNGTAAGSFQLNGAYTTIIIDASQAPGGPDGGDAIEFVFTGISPSNPNLQVTKTSSTNNDVSVGQTISYDIEIENTGSVRANNIRVTDILPSGVTYIPGSANSTYYTDVYTPGSFSYTMTPSNQTFNSTGLTQTYVVTNADIPSNAILTGYSYDVTVSTTDWLSEIYMIANYPGGGSVTAAPFGGNVSGSNVNQTGTGTINGSPSALGNYTFFWDDPNDFGVNTVNNATFTINYVVPSRSQVTNSVNAPANMIVESDAVNLLPGETMTVTLDISVDSGAAGTTITNTANLDADYFGGVSDTVSNNVLPDPCNPLTSGNPDFDGDGVSDICDLDDDNDGILDADECTESALINDSFEDYNVSDAVVTYGIAPNRSFQFDQANVNGWSTTAADGRIEIWESGHNGGDPAPTPSFDGGSHAEINATSDAQLYQDVATTPGSIITWSIWHRGRRGTDEANVLIGPAGGTLVVQQLMSSDNTAWVNYTGTYTVPAGQTTTRFGFESVSTAGGGIATGNFIDLFSVTICPDTDGDGISNQLDNDSDGDGCFDALE